MTTKITTLELNGKSDLAGGFCKQRKRYYEIISQLTDIESFHLSFPATVTFTEDLTCITEISVVSQDQKVLFTYPVCKNNFWTFDEISECITNPDSSKKEYKVLSNGFYFSDESLIDSKLPEKRSLGSNYNFHEISLMLKYQTPKMLEWIRRTWNAIASLSLLFRTKAFFRFTDILHVILLELNISLEDIRDMYIPGLIRISNGKVTMATTQNFDSIVTVSKSHTECTISNIKLVLDGKNKKLIADPGFSPENAEPIFVSLISNMRKEMDSVNGKQCV